MKKVKEIVKVSVPKKQWGKPAITKLDVATVTKSGPFNDTVEDPHNNFYGPVS